MPISQVQEIIRYTAPRTVASADPVVCGVISLRGRIVPVLDLGLRLGLARADAGEDSKIVIVEVGEDIAGLIVDDVTEVLTVHDEQLDDAPPAVHSDCLAGVAKVGERLVVILEPAVVIRSLDVADRPADVEPVTLHAVA